MTSTRLLVISFRAHISAKDNLKGEHYRYGLNLPHHGFHRALFHHDSVAFPKSDI